MYLFVREDTPRPQGHTNRELSSAERLSGRPWSSHDNLNEPVARARKGIEKGRERGYVGGMKVREKFLSRGLLLAIRAAPAASASSPGCLTMVRCRVRSLRKPWIVLANDSYHMRH